MEVLPREIFVVADDRSRSLHFVEDDSFDDDDSVCPLVDEVADQEEDMSIPSIVKEDDAIMSSVNQYDQATTTTALESVSSIGHEMADYFDMDCDLSSYSSEDEEEVRYNVTDITCPLCYFTVDGGEAAVLNDCGHAVCVSCFQEHIRSNYKTSSSVCCPMGSSTQCSKRLSRSLVRQIMATEVVLEAPPKKTVPSPSNYHCCPSVGCTNMIYWKEGNGPPIGDCFQCNRTSCLKCGVTPYHHNKSCSEYQASRLRPAFVPPMLIQEERTDRNSLRCHL